MRWIDLRTGYACNQACRFCDQGDLRARVPDATLPALVTALRAHPAEGVWLAGGEITLRPDLPALIRAARDAGFARVGLQTNGRVLAAPGAAEALRRAGLTDVALALPAATDALHAFLTGSPGGLRPALVGARRARAAGLTLRVTTVITRSGLSQLPALARLAVELGAEAHRWVRAREAGAAGIAVTPRLAALRAPLAEVVRFEQEARTDVETVGVPLCLLPGRGAVAADRVDAPAAHRVFPPGLEEAPVAHTQPPVCAACDLRAVCPGVDLAYLTRWGADELEPTRAPPPPGPTVYLPVLAACAAGCPGCATRAAFAGEWPTESTRALRQRLVRAAGAHPEVLVFAGASPWSHPALADLVREAVRLRFPRVEVWGPAFPVAAWEAPALERLAGLAEARVPAFDPVGVDRAATAAGEAKLREAGIPVTRASVGAPPGPLFGVVGPAATWSDCTPTGP